MGMMMKERTILELDCNSLVLTLHKKPVAIVSCIFACSFVSAHLTSFMVAIFGHRWSCLYRFRVVQLGAVVDGRVAV
jgi:hypothetical protein